MKSSAQQRRINSGQTLLELLIAIALFAILGNAIYTLVSSSYQMLGYSRARLAARHLAQEKVEMIRNLPFDKVGTLGGIPSGALEQAEAIERNGLIYTIRTSVVYIDDSFDQLAPLDLLPTDYKRARVEVSWQGLASSSRNPVVVITDIAPKGIETTTGGGTLSIQVFDSEAVPLAQAEVQIVATTVNPQINLTLNTSNDGIVILPGAPPCNNCYKITVSKNGYSQERTYSIAEVANPSKPHISILEGQLTNTSFSIDRTSTVTLLTYSNRQEGFLPLGNISFRLRGDKIIGTDALDEFVYKYQDIVTTDSSGSIELDLEWDNYTLILFDDSVYDISGTNPLIPFFVPAGTEITENISLGEISGSALLASFTDPSGTQIENVSVELKKSGDLIASASSGLSNNPDFGQVFFNSLSDGLHQLLATMSGYLDYQSDLNVSGYRSELIILTPD